jgi:TatD DNase family protein
VVQVGRRPAVEPVVGRGGGRYEQVHAAVALHPNEAGAGRRTDEALREVEALAALPQVVAVGETGLDHFRTETAEGHRLQEDSFRAHIAIAKRTGPDPRHPRPGRPRRRPARAARRGRPGPGRLPLLLRRRGDGRTCARARLLHELRRPCTFKPNDELRAAAAPRAAELLLVETDAPFLTPVPFRGRPNAPSLVPLTVRALAAVRPAASWPSCARCWPRTAGGLRAV